LNLIIQVVAGVFTSGNWGFQSNAEQLQHQKTDEKYEGHLPADGLLEAVVLRVRI